MVAFSSCERRSDTVRKLSRPQTMIGIAKVAFSLIVPVVLSTVLSTKLREPASHLGVAVGRGFHAQSSLVHEILDQHPDIAPARKSPNRLV